MKLNKNNDLKKHELQNILNYILDDENPYLNEVLDYLEINMPKIDFKTLKRNIEK